MKRIASNPACGVCGRFMSWQDCRAAVITAQHVMATALEPPDDVYNHRACFEAQEQRWAKQPAQEQPR